MKSRFLSILYVSLLVIAVGGAVYANVSLFQTKRDLSNLHNDTTTRITALETQLASTTERLASTETRYTALADELYTGQKRIEDVADSVQGVDRTIGKLSGTVTTLKKLTTTDRELLQKYSRVYFLNENYKPANLAVVDEEFDLVNGKEATVANAMWPFLKKLLEAAKEDGVDIMVLSGYRSFADQGTLKKTYTQKYGTGANSFSADQGYSEHQLGTAVDFTNKTIGETIDDFEQTEAFTWLTKNAYKYGFIMSYPKGNTYYMYEPWHWRFVGIDLATYLHRTGKNFYDLEQREIDGYLATLFDE